MACRPSNKDLFSRVKLTSAALDCRENLPSTPQVRDSPANLRENRPRVSAKFPTGEFQRFRSSTSELWRLHRELAFRPGPVAGASSVKFR